MVLSRCYLRVFGVGPDATSSIGRFVLAIQKNSSAKGNLQQDLKFGGHVH